MAPRSRPAPSSSNTDIPRRRLDLSFDPEAVPADFYADDTALTLVLAALSMVFPEGERFFVESVMHFRDRIDDPALLKDIKGFAGQEGMHAKEHAAFNAMLKAQGLGALADNIDRGARRLLRRGHRTHSAEARLAVTCALEHFTAMLAEQLLTDEPHREAFHPSVRGLWIWHALEESEHKAVAFDVYQAVDGSYWRRAHVMLTTTLFFFAFIAVSHLRLMAARGRLGDVRAHLRAFDYLWLRRGLFRRLVPAYLDYFRRDFHPNDRDTSALLATWRERLFGPEGLLREQLASASRSERAAA